MKAIKILIFPRALQPCVLVARLFSSLFFFSNVIEVVFCISYLVLMLRLDKMYCSFK